MYEQLDTQFTEDVAATQQHFCDREKCEYGRIINIGEPRLYIGNQDSTKPGKFVCEGCFKMYKTRLSTTRRVAPTLQKPTVPATKLDNAMSQQIANIRKDINQSQRQGVHKAPPGRIMGMPNTQGPWVSPGPRDFHAYFSGRTVPMAPSALPSAGYSAAHSQYQDARKGWAALASRGPSADILAAGSLVIQCIALYETFVGKGKSKSDFAVVPHIKEGKRVISTILPSQIIEIVKTGLLVKFNETRPGYPWNFNNLPVRERDTWEDVGLADPGLPYFGDRFMSQRVGTPKGSAKFDVFKAPKKPIEFVLIINMEQWLDAEEFEDNRQEKASQGSVKVFQSLKRKTPPSPTVNITAKLSRVPAPHETKVPNNSTQRKAKTVDSDSEEIEQILKTARVSKEPPRLISPDIIRKGIQLGGKANELVRMTDLNKRTHESIVYHPIHVLPLEDLLKGMGALQLEDHQYSRFGTISYIPDRSSPLFLGQGGFKTAFEAHLTLSQPVYKCLGRIKSSNGWTTVALKRPFEAQKDGKSIQHFSLVDEGTQVLSEANMLGWATSLLNFAYTYIDHHLDTFGQPSFPIPRLRFVQGAIAFPQRDVDTRRAAPVSNRAAYLLEEIIGGLELPFVKYIHNADATPLPDSDEDGYETGVFLCFIQHLQYIKTGRLIYISDCQGGRTLLTDPQIMTDPAIGHDLFGAGNIEEAFLAFPKQHLCNKYCAWMGMDKLHDE